MGEIEVRVIITLIHALELLLIGLLHTSFTSRLNTLHQFVTYIDSCYLTMLRVHTNHVSGMCVISFILSTIIMEIFAVVNNSQLKEIVKLKHSKI